MGSIKQLICQKNKTSKTMRIVSWNVNGLRACVKKGFHRFLNDSKADVVALQEVRAFPDQLDDKTRSPSGWHAFFHPSERPGYSGVAIYTREKPTKVIYGLGMPIFDIEGRFMAVQIGRLTIASVYFPKGSGKDRDNSRVKYKLDFYQAVFEKIQKLRRLGPTIVTGDYNTAHTEIDLARPKTNHKNSGFLPEEREELDRWIAAGWSDSFRIKHPQRAEQYSWWRQWGDARSNNVGWRIDYLFTSPSATKKIAESFILTNVFGSDHCPVGVDIK